MTEPSFQQNQDLITSIQCVELNFQERLREFISAVKERVSSTNRAEAERLFLSALPVFLLKLPDPTKEAVDTKETNHDSQLELTGVIAEFYRLKTDIDNLKAELGSLQSLNTLSSQLEKLKNEKHNVKPRGAVGKSELQKTHRTTENHFAEQRNLLHNVMLREQDQTRDTTCLPSAPVDAADASPSASPVVATRVEPLQQDIQQRITFESRLESDKECPCVEDVEILPSGLIILADWGNSSIKVFDTQGQHLHSHCCITAPYRVAVMPSHTNSASSTVAVILPRSDTIECIEVSNQGIQQKNSLQTSRGYRSVTALDHQTLALGYKNGNFKGFDVVDMTGRILRQLTSDIEPIEPWYMAATAEGNLVCTTASDRIVKLNATTGQVLYNITVPHIKNPQGISELPDGSLLIADGDTNALHQLTPQGLWMRQLFEITAQDRPRCNDQLQSVATTDNGVCVCVTDGGSVCVLDAVY